MTQDYTLVKPIKNNELQHENFEFNGYVLHAGRRELSREGVEIELEPKVFELLLYLLKHRERAVSKDELQDKVWPGMVITETALTRAVMKARKAVGDDAGSQSVIKTLHGHGYRFIAELATPGSGEIPSAGQQAAPGYVRQDRTRRWVWPSLALLVLLFALALGWQHFRPAANNHGDLKLAVLPLQNLTEDEGLAWTSLGLMSFASNLLAAADEFTLIPDGSVVSLSDSLDWKGGLETESAAALLERLHRVFGASHVLSMQLVREGKLLRINYSLVDASGTRQRGTMVGDEATDLTKGVVQGVFGLLLRRSRLSPDTPLVSVDPFNNEAFARGLGLSLQGRCAEAVQFFRVIIEQEPTLFLPRYELASCLRILGQNDEAEPLLLQLVEEQEKLGQSQELAQTLMTLGVLYNRTGRLKEAEATHRYALDVSQGVDHPELTGKILQNLSIVREDLNDWKGAEELLDRAVLEYQRSGLEMLPGQLYSARANLRMDRGELLEADGFLVQALHVFREMGDRGNEAMMLSNTGYLRRRQGRIEEAADYLVQALNIREEIGDRVGVGRTLGQLSAVHTALGQYQPARETALRALEIARETSDRLFEGTSLAQLGDAEQALGEMDAARLHFAEGRAVFESIQDQMRVLQSDLKLARLDLSEDKLAAAAAKALQVVQATVGQDLVQPEVEAIELLGDIAVVQGDFQTALDEYTSALERVRQSTWAGKENTLSFKLADVYLELGQLDAAAPLVGALSQQEPNVSSLSVQARYSFLVGDSQLAVTYMEQARALAGENWSEENNREYLTYQAAAGQEHDIRKSE